ncbi:MAG: hypothetical protein ONB48_12115 [candidate division KSB1 bacterium]|nr:hypothetical protein [candidate division KSB1 bacterium]MDZ7274017.1 hypothetical protein [candidate division KSB1 bacterium]MDZ7286390.1 hypothetical protein [candidate division KSB1 bacterium]MDZ7296618.1 hypothetical protein [candidate division KSB1 bacterium]MDZ7306840.1 hypothetical protein [candidate division KSB1 bacterium]
MIQRNFLLLPLLAALLPAGAYGQGGYAGAFLRTGVAARSEAMGRACVAMVEGNESAHYNPGSVAWFDHRELTVSYRTLALDRTFAYLSFGVPIRPATNARGQQAMNGGISLAWIHAGVDDIDARDFDGQKLEPLSAAEDAFSLSFALQPHPKLGVGLTSRVIFNRLPGVKQDGGGISASTFGFDFGALLQPVSGVQLGLAVSNVNLKYTWKTEGVYDRGTSIVQKFPRGVRAGIAVSRLLPWLTLAADVEKRQFRDGTLHLGAVATLREIGTLRAGLNDGQPSFGAGYRFGILGRRSELHYAFVTHADHLDSDHVFGWAFIF